MNEKFLELAQDKRKKILNAAIEVFAAHEYKHAVTDDIAAKAGISKGLLFYYFQNKRGLYMYTYQYCFELMKDMLVDDEFEKITDFFDLLEFGANKKMALLSEYPGITEFALRAYYSQNETISDEINQGMRTAMGETYGIFFKHVDFHKFKEGTDIAYMYRMLVWMTDGYLHEKQATHQKIDLKDVMKEFEKWKDMFRRMVYKEEYL